MRKGNRKTKIRFFTVLIIVIFGSFFVSSFIKGIRPPLLRSMKNRLGCSYTNPERDSYLDTYTVQKGDTILSIARDQMGDPSRVNELIELNKSGYPDLSLSNSFLEVGWKLYVTPKSIGKTSGKLFMNAGKITDLSEEKITLKNYKEQESYGYHYIGESTIFEGKKKESFGKGDCVYILSDVGNFPGTLRVILQ